MASAPKFDALVEAVEKAEKALETAKEKLSASLDTVEDGYTFTVADLPMQVVVVNGKKEVKPMLTKRQIAALRGQPVPPIKRRKPKPEAASDKAAE